MISAYTGKQYTAIIETFLLLRPPNSRPFFFTFCFEDEFNSPCFLHSQLNIHPHPVTTGWPLTSQQLSGSYLLSILALFSSAITARRLSRWFTKSPWILRSCIGSFQTILVCPSHISGFLNSFMWQEERLQRPKVREDRGDLRWLWDFLSKEQDRR